MATSIKTEERFEVAQRGRHVRALYAMFAAYPRMTIEEALLTLRLTPEQMQQALDDYRLVSHKVRTDSR